MLLDIRERELRLRLPSWPTKQLPVGDIWIGLSGEHIAVGGVVAERKTADDLEASILDGRYREQRTRLLSYCSQQGGRPLYIVEGDLDRLYGRLTKQALTKYLTRLSLRYGVAIWQTASLDETAELCRILADQYAEDATVFQAQAQIVKYTETISASRKTNQLAHLGSAMLQQCPGVSARVADSLMAHFQSFPGVIAASETELAAVKAGERKVGPAVAKRLWSAFHQATP